MKRPAILERLRGVQRAGAGWLTFCPAHRDHEQRSLSVSVAADGKTLLHCFVGCSVERIVAAVNMSLADLMGSAEAAAAGTTLTLNAFAAAKQLPVDFLRAMGVDEYRGGLRITYRLANGSLAPRQRLRTALVAKEGSRWLGPKGEALVAYGLWRLEEAREKGELFDLEGESDTLTAWFHNVPGLGIPGADLVKVITADVLAGIGTIWIVREPDLGGETFVAGHARRLHELGWKGRAMVVTLPTKDLNDLHREAGTDFADQLAAAQRRARPLELVGTDRAEPSAAAESHAPVLVCLGDVAPEPVDWLWDRRIARGKLALVIGEPGTGKTYATLDMTARVTLGAAWPDGGRAMAGNVLLLASEDGLADTVRPIVDRQGGDARRVHVLQAVRVEGQECGFTLERDLPALDAALEQTGALVVVISPLSAYLGSKDSYKDAEIRGILTPLAALAERRRVAMIGVMHLTKDQQRRLVNRAQGSIAFVAQARTVLVVGKDANAPDRRLLAAVKNNLALEAPALAFRITDAGLTWESAPIEGSAEALLAQDEPVSRAEGRERDQAITFLRDLLADGPINSKQVMADAKANGIALRTLWRARAELVKEIEVARTKGQTGPWYWMLRSPQPGPPTTANEIEW